MTIDVYVLLTTPTQLFLAVAQIALIQIIWDRDLHTSDLRTSKIMLKPFWLDVPAKKV